MTRLLLLAVLLLIPSSPVLAQPAKPLVDGLVNPESVCVAPNGKMYATVIGEFNKDGDGSVVLIEDGKAKPFVMGLDDPKGVVVYSKWLFVTDKTQVLRIELSSGKKEVFAAAKSFPNPPQFLNDITVDPENGLVYVSDSGDLKGKGGAVYRITPKGAVGLVVDEKVIPNINIPNGVILDGSSHLLLADFGSGELHRINLFTRTAQKVADSLGSPDGLAWDMHGRLFISDYKGGQVYVIPRPGEKPVLAMKGFKTAADICYDPIGKRILVPDMAAGTVVPMPTTVPSAPVDESPLPISTAVAFPNLKWTGWKSVTDSGKVFPLRPILLTHSGDGSNRIFVPTQQGVIHVFPNDQAAKETTIFLDIQDRVRYNDNTNEEGFLGVAFHPKYKQNGEFFVFYTTKKEPLTNIVSKFRVSKDDPNKADPASEQEIIRFKKPFWNHDGGTICFGPDGMLYVTHGDGGAANDPRENGQNKNSLLGKVLRIDINAKEDGKNYTIPKDNPFVGQQDVRPEIWAYGLRNIWRMSFDRKTGKLWAGEVGQNLFEEINIIEKGGNYGWNRRESLHPFGANGVGSNKDMIDPIWEYHHDVGKSITGGTVYRGPRISQLDGYYLYADYVTNRMWALKYDEKLRRVVENRVIQGPSLPVYSYGEDEKGEVYFLTASGTGKGIYWFVK